MKATVAKLKKNTSSEVWVCLCEYQGKQFVDIREHFLLAEDRKWHPTKKGIRISPTHLPKLIDGVELLEGVTEVKTVATIPKSDRDEIEVAVREYEGNRYGEIRIWYWVAGGAKKPAKGVTFKLELIDSLLEALRSAEERLDQ